MLEHLQSLFCPGALLLTWIMTPGGKAGVWGQGAVKPAEGKHSSCYQAKKDPSGCAQSAAQHSGCMDGREKAHSRRTPGQFKGNTVALVSSSSIHDPLIWETNPLNQIGLSCSSLLGCGCLWAARLLLVLMDWGCRVLIPEPCRPGKCEAEAEGCGTPRTSLMCHNYRDDWAK